MHPFEKARALVLLGLVASSSASAQAVILTGIDGRRVSVRESALKSFASSDAENAVSRIVGAAGIKPNFKVVASDDPSVANAAAMVDDKGSTRYILYAPKFMNSVSASGKTSWAALGILAHEIGHHLNGHTMARGQLTADASRQQELDADEFAGVQLARLGASQPDALSMLAGVPDQDTYTHPRRSARVEAVRRGWCTGSAKPSVGFAPAAGTASCGSEVSAAAPTRSGAQLLNWDFANPAAATTRLREFEYDKWRAKYAFGGYAIIDKDFDEGVQGVRPSGALPNPVEIEVTGFLNAGDRKSATWGLAFGVDSGFTAYYAALVNSNGEFILQRKTEGALIDISAPLAHAAIQQGVGGQNKITVRLNGASAEFLVNDVPVKKMMLAMAPVGRVMLLSRGHEDGDSDMTVVFLSLRAWAR